MGARITAKIARQEVEDIQPNDWVLDSAATHFFCADETQFESLDVGAAGEEISMANGDIVKSGGRGTVRLLVNGKSLGRRTPHELLLHEVVYAPALEVNLLSTFMLTEMGLRVVVDGAGKPSEIQSSEDHDLAVANLILMNNLYFLDVVEDSPMQANAATAGKKPNRRQRRNAVRSIKIWHRRLGHLNIDDVKDIQRVTLGVGFHKPTEAKQEPEPVCQACTQGKQVKKRISRKRRPQSKKPFDLIHSDICGPFPISKDKCRYFITFTDDFTRYVWVKAISTKDEAINAFTRFYLEIETQFGVKIKRVQSDNGSEYSDQPFQSFMDSKSILWEPTIAYNPFENGVSERQNRTLMNYIRTIFADSDLPISLWSELLESAAYLRNRSPTKHLKGKTPYEALFGEKPDLSNLRIIGCQAWALIPREKRSKFDLRSSDCRLLGYAASTQYILYEVDSGRVIFSRDVIFDESPEAEAGHPPPDWTFDFDCPDELMQSICPYTQRSLSSSSQAVEPFSAPRVIDRVEASTGESSAQPPVKLPAKSRGKRRGRPKAKPKVKPTPTPEPTIESSMPPADEEPNEMLDFLQSNIPDEVSFSNYGRKRMPSRLLRDAKAGSWMTALSTSCNANRQLRALATSKFEREPKSYREAMESVNRTHWKVAMDDQYQSLIENKTWVLVKRSDVPPCCRVLNGKWVYKLKTSPDKEHRYKARWVAKGFNQRYGVDYFETFAAVAKPMSYKILLALAAHYNLEVHQMDVKSAFLYGDLDEEIYLNLPDGFQDGGDGDVVCRLLKSLYGLKQAPRVWAKVLREFLVSHGLARLESDHCIYVGKDLIVAIYVDDILILSKNKRSLRQMKEELKSRFKMSDLGHAKHYLGIEIHRTKEKICLTQTEYITDMLKRFGMEDCAPKATPMEEKIRLDIDVAGEPLCETDKERYQQAIGSLLYLSLGTRPDISFAVAILSRFTANPHEKHETALNRIFRYLRGTLDVGITYYAAKSPIPTGFTDASFAHPIVKEGRRSTSGYIFFMAGGPVSWSCKRQSTVATSSTEAEYIGQYNAAREATWIRSFLEELGSYRDLIKDPIIIKADSQPAETLALDPAFHTRAKHLDVAYHWQRQQVDRKVFEFEDIPSKDNGADGLSKPLGPQLYRTFKDLIHMNEI